MSPKTERRKIIVWAAGLLSVFAFTKIFPGKKPDSIKVRMLSEDGELVEIDEKHLLAQIKAGRAGEKISCVPNGNIPSGENGKTRLESIRDFVKRK